MPILRRWWHPKVPEKLRQCASEGHRLVVFSNQSGIGVLQKHYAHLAPSLAVSSHVLRLVSPVMDALSFRKTSRLRSL